MDGEPQVASYFPPASQGPLMRRDRWILLGSIQEHLGLKSSKPVSALLTGFHNLGSGCGLDQDPFLYPLSQAAVISFSPKATEGEPAPPLSSRPQHLRAACTAHLLSFQKAGTSDKLLSEGREEQVPQPKRPILSSSSSVCLHSPLFCPWFPLHGQVRAVTQESGDRESRAWGWEVWDRTHVRTCVDVSVHVFVSQLGSGKGAELGSQGQEGLGVHLVLRGELGLEGTV